MKAKAQKNSGRGLYQKGDAVLDVFTVDIKEYAKTFGVSRTVWGKICSDAARNGNEPALMLALGAGRETVRLWIVADDMFKEMLDAWKEKYG